VSETLVENARAALGAAYLRTGDYDAVDALVGRALEEAESDGDRKAAAAAIALRGMTLHFRAIDVSPEERAAIDPGPEEELFERALALRREIEDTEGVAESLFQLGLVHQVLRRDLETGSPYFREALALVEAEPDPDVLLRSEIHRHVGFDLLLREEQPEEAIGHLRASLELRTSLAERGWLAGALVALALAERLAGRPDAAADSSRQALELAREEGLRDLFVAAAEDSLRAAEESRASG
jgi:tetratricopeptide (TPR) repeat protein